MGHRCSGSMQFCSNTAMDRSRLPSYGDCISLNGSYGSFVIALCGILFNLYSSSLLIFGVSLYCILLSSLCGCENGSLPFAYDFVYDFKSLRELFITPELVHDPFEYEYSLFEYEFESPDLVSCDALYDDDDDLLLNDFKSWSVVIIDGLTDSFDNESTSGLPLADLLHELLPFLDGFGSFLDVPVDELVSILDVPDDDGIYIRDAYFNCL
eukprot:383294_1